MVGHTLVGSVALLLVLGWWMRVRHRGKTCWACLLAGWMDVRKSSDWYGGRGVWRGKRCVEKKEA